MYNRKSWYFCCRNWIKKFQKYYFCNWWKDKISESGQYTFYSKLESETLTLTQHPGDGKYEISIFNVKHSSKASIGFRILNVDSFKTEKGIGMNKKQIIEKLGNAIQQKTAQIIILSFIIKLNLQKTIKQNY